MKQLHLHWLNKSFMLYQCTVHGGLRFSVQGPRATDFFWQWACGPAKVCIFFIYVPMHLSQAALPEECPLILPRLTFWASSFDVCPKICRVQHKNTLPVKGWYFISELWPTKAIYHLCTTEISWNMFPIVSTKEKIQHNDKVRNIFLSTYLLVVFTIFLNCDCCLHFAL